MNDKLRYDPDHPLLHKSSECSKNSQKAAAAQAADKANSAWSFATSKSAEKWGQKVSTLTNLGAMFGLFATIILLQYLFDQSSKQSTENIDQVEVENLATTSNSVDQIEKIEEELPILTENTVEVEEEELPILTENTIEVEEEVLPILTENTIEVEEEVLPILTENTVEVEEEVLPILEELIPEAAKPQKAIAIAKAKPQHKRRKVSKVKKSQQVSIELDSEAARKRYRSMNEQQISDGLFYIPFEGPATLASK